MNCGVSLCGYKDKQNLGKFDNGLDVFYLCPSHQAIWATGRIKKEFIQKSRSHVKKLASCEVCNHSGWIADFPDLSVHLCNNHLRKLLLRALSPSEHKGLYSRHGESYLLGGNFYDKDHEALKPFVYIAKLSYKY